MDQVESLVPGDRLEGVLAAGSHALQRVGEPPGAVHELGVGARNLVADYARRVRIGLRAAHVEDAGPVGPDRKAAGIGTIERADTGPRPDDFGDGHDGTSSCWTSGPVGRRAWLHRDMDSVVGRGFHPPGRDKFATDTESKQNSIEERSNIENFMEPLTTTPARSGIVGRAVTMGCPCGRHGREDASRKGVPGLARELPHHRPPA